ncbi:MAG: methionyl-tRNA formyltransferase [Campylobacterota bacterium]
MARIVFMGTPEYAKVILQKHIEKGDTVLAVVTQPDKPVGRKRVITAPPVKLLAQHHGIEVLQPQKLGEDTVEQLKAMQPDFLIVAAYGQLLPQSMLDIATPINLHASLLPKYRGASPVQECILNGDAFAGVTAMQMELGLDSGPILGYRAFALTGEETLGCLMQLLADAAAQLSVATLRNFNRIEPLEQCGALKSYCKKIKTQDGCIEFDSAQSVDAKFRAYYGWPGVYLASKLKIKQLQLLENRSKNIAGEILAIDDSGITVGCQRGSVLISQLQPAGKKVMDAKSYCNGKRLHVADILL